MGGLSRLQENGIQEKWDFFQKQALSTQSPDDHY
jgi:hypothetical protein